jgi:hypothetical protein
MLHHRDAGREKNSKSHRRAAGHAEETFLKNTDFKHVILCVLCELRVSAVRFWYFFSAPPRLSALRFSKVKFFAFFPELRSAR